MWYVKNSPKRVFDELYSIYDKLNLFMNTERGEKKTMITSQKNNKNGTLLTYKELAEDANLSVNTVKKLAQESNSILRIGARIVRIDKEKFYSYLRNKYTVKDNDQ